MSAKKNLKEKISNVQENKIEDSMILTEEESIHFKDEINKQLSETKIIDIGKAMRNARYLAMLDESFKQAREGKIVSFTEEEWENFTNEQELH